MKIYKKLFFSLALLYLLIIPFQYLSAEIQIGQSLPVKILYDLSGSMYPGYPDIPKQEAGVNYFYQYPEFREWMTGFIGQQTIFDASTVALYTFRSGEQFEPEDIREIHPPIPVTASQSQTAELLSNLQRPMKEDFTYLRESLDYITANGFEGIIWIITDNRVETPQSNQTTRDFFISLKNQDKYRSVHIYKLPFDDRLKNRHADLAVYGIMVSPEPITPKTASDFDKRFHAFKNYFPEKQHLKLKDLRVDPVALDIRATLGVDISGQNTQTQTEGKLKGIPFAVGLESKLTQHTITGGQLLIQLEGDLIPKDKNQIKKYGLKSLPASYFQPARLTLAREIPPCAKVDLGRFQIYSQKSFNIPVTGFWNRLQAAIIPFSVEFTGHGVLGVEQLALALKQEGVNSVRGIYSSGDIGSIFLPEEEKVTIRANPIAFDVSFTLQSGSSRGLVLLLAVLGILVPLAFLTIFLRKQESYRLRIKEKEIRIMLRRLGSHDLTVDGISLGYVKRGLGNSLDFFPHSRPNEITFKGTKNPGEFLVSLVGSSSFYIYIDRLKPGYLLPESHSVATETQSIGTPTGGPAIKIRPPKR